MPLIERKQLAQGSASESATTFGVFFDNALVSAAAPQIITFNLGRNVVRESLQVNIINTTLPRTSIQIGFATATPSDGIRVIRGTKFINTTAMTHEIVGLSDIKVQQKIANDPNFEYAGKGQTPLPGGLFRDDAGNILMVLSVFRPHGHVLFSSAGQIIHVFFPYTVDVEVTGFETSEFSQDSGINEEKISIDVIDTTSQSLYGERPSVNELQSDFIETESQAIRVGEAFLWNKNKVLEVRILTLFNPGIKRGATVKVTNADKTINVQGIVKTVGHLFDIERGDALTELIVQSTEYIFQSHLGASNQDEKLDARQ